MDEDKNDVRADRNEDLVGIDVQQEHVEQKRDELYACYLGFALVIVYILWVFYDIHFHEKPGTLDFFQENGRLALVCFVYLVFIFGYFPEHYKYWVSAYRTMKSHGRLLTRERAELTHLALGSICLIVFFGFVDFSFLGVKKGLPEIGSVAALSIIGLIANIYRLRKANWQERKRKREREAHIQRIRDRRNPPDKK